MGRLIDNYSILNMSNTPNQEFVTNRQSYYESFNNITLDDFHIRDIFKLQLEVSKIDSGSALLYALEMYKMINPSDIKTVMEKLIPDDIKGEVSINVEPLIDLPPELANFVLENRVMISEYTQNTVTVILDMFSEINLPSLELMLHKYDFKYVFVTHYYYNNIIGEENSYPDIHLLSRRIIIDAIDKNVTDVHFDTYHDINLQSHWRLRYRAGLDLVDIDYWNMSSEEFVTLINSLIEDKTKGVTRDISQTGGTVALASNFILDGTVNLRVSVDKLYSGMDSVIRIQNLKTVSKTVDQLGFEDREVSILKRTSLRRNGLTLITGPIRTGKNTTAFAVANEMLMNNNKLKIKDLSSPIESLVGYGQVDYMGNEELLKHHLELFVKQDINAVTLNEIPSKRTAFAVLSAVNANIHVITTFHSGRLFDVPKRLFELFGEDYRNVIDELNVLCTQKLFETVCPNCSKKFSIDKLDNQILKEVAKNLNVFFYYENTGCKRCSDVFSKMVQPCVEILEITEEIKEELVAMSSPYEMKSYLKNLLYKNKFNIEEEVARYISSGKISITALEQFI